MLSPWNFNELDIKVEEMKNIRACDNAPLIFI